MADWNSGPTYTLGPISAAEGSPIGGFLAWMQGTSSDFATGNAVYTGNPSLAVSTILNPGTVYQNAAALNTAYQAGVGRLASEGPIGGIGQTIGNVLGTGIGVVGGAVGIGGRSAAPGVASGASNAASGVAQVGTAGVTSAVAGGLQGVLSGIGTTLQTTTGATGGQSSTFLYVAGALALVVLYIALT